MFFKKCEKRGFCTFCALFSAKSAILFVKIRLIIHFLKVKLLTGRLVFWWERSKFDLLIEVFARFFRVSMRGWFFALFKKGAFLQVLILGVQN